MRHELKLQYSSMICVATKDSSRTKFETKNFKTMKGAFSVIFYLKRQA